MGYSSQNCCTGGTTIIRELVIGSESNIVKLGSGILGESGLNVEVGTGKRSTSVVVGRKGNRKSVDKVWNEIDRSWIDLILSKNSG